MENRPHIATAVFTLFMAALLLFSGVVAPANSRAYVNQSVEKAAATSNEQEESQLPEASISEWQAVASLTAVRFIPLSFAAEHLPFAWFNVSLSLELLLGKNPEKPLVFPFLLEINQTLFRFIISPNAP